VRLLYCDESNLNHRDSDFFVYGGVAINASAAPALSTAIERVRTDAGIPPEFVLKFNPGPLNLQHQQFAEVKRAIVEAAVSHGCIFLTSLILHLVATSAEEARRNEINRLCYHFHSYLNHVDDCGLVLIDQFDDPKINEHLRQKFHTGVIGMPYSRSIRLERILGFHYAAIGQSHFGSLVDIVLGSFRYAVNAFSRGEAGRLSGAETLLRLIAPLFYRQSSGRLREVSLFFSPKVIRSQSLRHRYEGLKVFLANHGIDAEQDVTDQRNY
jgi:hypothetical protein